MRRCNKVLNGEYATRLHECHARLVAIGGGGKTGPAPRFDNAALRLPPSPKTAPSSPSSSVARAHVVHLWALFVVVSTFTLITSRRPSDIGNNRLRAALSFSYGEKRKNNNKFSRHYVSTRFPPPSRDDDRHDNGLLPPNFVLFVTLPPSPPLARRASKF